MRSRVHKWGNSLAIRIPKPFAEEVGLLEDAPVEVSIRDNEVVVTSVLTYSLSELLAKVTSDNIHHEVETGQAVGTEVW